MGGVTHILSIYDALLAPIYFFLFLFWVMRWKKKYYAQSSVKKYILPAFILKSICCILLSFLYEFYYGYSDAQNYYSGAIEIWNATKQNPVYGLELVFKPFEACPAAAQEFGSYMSNPMFATSVVNMFKTAGFIGMFCFGTYLPIALFISLLCFIGSWKIFMVFNEEFPAYSNKVAITCLFAPSFIFWGTNIMKDPLTIFGLGLAFSSLYKLMRRRISFFILLELIAGSLVMLLYKSYVFYIFCFAGFCGLYTNYITHVSNRFQTLVKLMALITVVSLITLSFIFKVYLAEIISSGFLNEVTFIQTSQSLQGGSMYILPNVDDFSFFGIIRTYFNAINVALFRPYLWEVPNIIAIANALESFIVLVFTTYLLIKLKITGFFSIAFKNRLFSFALIFTLLLAPLAGLVSFNFGTLVRYKAPAVPFFYTYLLLLYYKLKQVKKRHNILT